MYETVLRAVHRRRGHLAVLDAVLAAWDTLGVWVCDSRLTTRLGSPAIDTIARTVSQILTDIVDPVELLASRKDSADRTKRARMGELLAHVLLRLRVPEDAVNVVEEMRRQKLPVPVDLPMGIVRSLARVQAYELANGLYASIDPAAVHKKTYLATGLHLFSLQGDIERVEQIFKALEGMRQVGLADIGMRMHAYAVKGDTESVLAQLNKYYPPDRGTRPTIMHYTAVIMAHARARDLDGMNFWLEEMTKNGVFPDRHIYDIILQSFARRGEVDTVAKILEQMRLSGKAPQAPTYTNIISMLAQRQDPVAAEAIYKLALKEGIRPDRQMIAALMTAHAEAGSWRGVIRSFDFMASSQDRQHRPRIDVYNILLKAYVMIGTPFSVVSNVYRRIEEERVQPTIHTFSLLIQSACDSAEMDVATRLFSQLDELSQRWETGLTVNVYALTIIMSGYLRLGNKIKAKEVYDDMLARGIKPTSVTFNAILKAYGNEGSEESIRLAEEFLQSLMKQDPAKRTWLDPLHRRFSGYEHVYRPLMATFARHGQPLKVEELYAELLAEGGEPSISFLTQILHAYRNTGNLDAVREVWSEIFEMGLRFGKVDALFEGADAGPREDLQRRANILCVPLSIVMDALSLAGFHDEVAGVWHNVQTHGFAFDAHNWNHLAIVLVRAGEPLRAFQVLERVIIPYQQLAQADPQARETEARTPLLFDDIAPLKDNEVEAAPQMTNISHDMRARAVKLAKARMGRSLDPPPDRPNDVLHELHTLYQITPGWNLWQPHDAVLGLLVRVVEHLEEDKLVRPLLQAGDDGVGRLERGREDEAAEARRVLRAIVDSCPRAFAAVDEHSQRLRAQEEMRVMMQED
ncbi:hypothetical protein BV25DRAFT_1792801 [Artomyces pyxidatus]|uniref:Uncharacterized protein n=1 Tax=Artomyces pyxidatus TaxID=48021 RepID=A0ACB8TJI7_9AGAM|nr:hypothetical protein BV25DRAFT_1792801 [Artomyces pyxidatus]